MDKWNPFESPMFWAALRFRKFRSRSGTRTRDLLVTFTSIQLPKSVLNWTRFQVVSFWGSEFISRGLVRPRRPNNSQNPALHTGKPQESSLWRTPYFWEPFGFSITIWSRSEIPDPGRFPGPNTFSCKNAFFVRDFYGDFCEQSVKSIENTWLLCVLCYSKLIQCQRFLF